MSLADVKHQGPAQRTLQRAMAGGRVHHAYIFHGLSGVGKEMLARRLAQVLLCSATIERDLQDADAEIVGVDRLVDGCGRCDDCRAVTGQSHPDLHLVYRQLNREHPDPAVRRRKGLELGVDVLRQFVIDRVGLTSARGRAKVYIIREADRITPAAQNALLKTLEEPPASTVIILLVAALDRLLPTTLSRCQVVRFDPLPTEFTRTKLGELLPDTPREHLDWYASCANGSLGTAMERAEDQWYELNQRLIDTLVALAGAGVGSTVKTWTDASKALGTGYRKRDPEITDTEATRRGFKAIFQLAATYYADVLRAGTTPSSPMVNTAWQAEIKEAARRIDLDSAAGAVNRIAQAERHLDLNANTQLVMETLLSDLADVAGGVAASA